MDKKLLETTNLGEEIMNSKQQVLKEETWSRGANSCLPFDVNVMLNLSYVSIDVCGFPQKGTRARVLPPPQRGKCV